MRYTARELRLIDAFALLLVGAGILLVVLGAFDLATAGRTHRVIFHRETRSRGQSGSPAARLTVEREGAHALTLGWTWAVEGLVLVCLGGALNLGLRRVVRNGGEGPEALAVAAGHPGGAHTAGAHTGPAHPAASDAATPTAATEGG